MSELSINEKRKILRREFKQVDQENGFRFIRPNTLLRERNNILQYLQFKIKAGSMGCDIVSQPLYIPSERFSLSISTGIQHLGKRTRMSWGSFDRTEEEFSLDVQDMLQLIASGGLRWFDAMGVPENLIRNTLDKNFSKLVQGYAPALRLSTVAMSHLYLGHVNEGILYMEKLMSEYGRYPNSELCSRRIAECQRWIALAKEHPDDLPAIFESIIAQTRSALRIK